MYYKIRHVTRFRYSAPIRQSVMELRMLPRTETPQRCLDFQIMLNPAARLSSYRDYLGNTVHHFDIPGEHRALTITAQAVVEMRDHRPLPQNLPASAWTALEQLGLEEFDFLLPGRFTYPTRLLEQLAAELDARRRDDPLTLVRDLNARIYHAFQYMPESTSVDSPIDEALYNRQGVCQDFAHIMITLLRGLGIPCRYISGYLFHRVEDRDRSAEDASHAWVEAWLPHLGWVGFDPTNNLTAGERHIRVAIGRDYADVPPTRGIFKGEAESELRVSVTVSPTSEPPTDTSLQPADLWSVGDMAAAQQAQQQQ